MDPQRHHRREPLIAAEPAPVRPLSAYVAKRCPRPSPTRSGRTRRTTPTVRRHTDATRRSGRLLGHLSWLSCGQWPAQTWVFVDQTASPGLQIEATTSAIAARVAVVVGARLPDDAAAARSGAPDVLVCARGGYVAVDVKHPALNCGDLTSAQRPVRVKRIGVDPYRLDRDQDGNACE